jgi:alpha-glucosidase (family GH31 glycosyl hydrolase)
MQGPDLLVSPVVVRANSSTGLASVTTWLPPGLWFSETTGELLSSPKDGMNVTMVRASLQCAPAAAKPALPQVYDLDEVPVFVRGGAIIATRPVVSGCATSDRSSRG